MTVKILPILCLVLVEQFLALNVFYILTLNFIKKMFQIIFAPTRKCTHFNKKNDLCKILCDYSVLKNFTHIPYISRVVSCN